MSSSVEAAQQAVTAALNAYHPNNKTDQQRLSAALWQLALAETQDSKDPSALLGNPAALKAEWQKLQQEYAHLPPNVTSSDLNAAWAAATGSATPTAVPTATPTSTATPTATPTPTPTPTPTSASTANPKPSAIKSSITNGAQTYGSQSAGPPPVTVNNAQTQAVTPIVTAAQNDETAAAQQLSTDQTAEQATQTEINNLGDEGLNAGTLKRLQILDALLAQEKQTVAADQHRVDAAKAKVAAGNVVLYSEQQQSDQQTATASAGKATGTYDSLTQALPQGITLKQGDTLTAAQIKQLDARQLAVYDSYLQDQGTANRDQAKVNADIATLNANYAQLQVYVSDPKYGSVAADAINAVNVALQPFNESLPMPQAIRPPAGSHQTLQQYLQQYLQQQAQAASYYDAVWHVDSLSVTTLNADDNVAALQQQVSSLKQQIATYENEHGVCLSPSSPLQQQLSQAQTKLKQAEGTAHQDSTELNVATSYFEQLQGQMTVEQDQQTVAQDQTTATQWSTAHPQLPASDNPNEPALVQAQQKLSQDEQLSSALNAGFLASYGQLYAFNQGNAVTVAQQNVNQIKQQIAAYEQTHHLSQLPANSPLQQQLNQAETDLTRAQANARAAQQVAGILSDDANVLGANYNLTIANAKERAAQQLVTTAQQNVTQAQTAYTQWSRSNPTEAATEPDNPYSTALNQAETALAQAKQALTADQQQVQVAKANYDGAKSGQRWATWTPPSTAGDSTPDADAAVAQSQYQFFEHNGPQSLAAGQIEQETQQFGTGPQHWSGTQLTDMVGLALGLTPTNGAAAQQGDTSVNWYSGEALTTINSVTAEIQKLGGKNAAVTVVPLVYAASDTGVMNTALFKVSGGGQTYYVDLQGAKYASIDDYIHNNNLSTSGTVYMPTDGVMSHNSDGSLRVTSFQAHQNTAGQSLLNFLSSSGVMIAGIGMDVLGTGLDVLGGVLEVGSLGIATPLVAVMEVGGTALDIAGTTTMIASFGGSALNSGLSLYARSQHDLSDSWSDPAARAEWTNLGISLVGTFGSVAKLGAEFAEPLKLGGTAASLKGAAGVLNTVTAAGAVANTADQIYNLASNWNDMTTAQQQAAIGSVVENGMMFLAPMLTEHVIEGAGVKLLNKVRSDAYTNYTSSNYVDHAAGVAGPNLPISPKIFDPYDLGIRFNGKSLRAEDPAWWNAGKKVAVKTANGDPIYLDSGKPLEYSWTKNGEVTFWDGNNLLIKLPDGSLTYKGKPLTLSDSPPATPASAPRTGPRKGIETARFGVQFRWRWGGWVQAEELTPDAVRKHVPIGAQTAGSVSAAIGTASNWRTFVTALGQSRDSILHPPAGTSIRGRLKLGADPIVLALSRLMTVSIRPAEYRNTTVAGLGLAPFSRQVEFQTKGSTSIPDAVSALLGAPKSAFDAIVRGAKVAGSPAGGNGVIVELDASPTLMPRDEVNTPQVDFQGNTGNKRFTLGRDLTLDKLFREIKGYPMASIFPLTPVIAELLDKVPFVGPLASVLKLKFEMRKEIAGPFKFPAGTVFPFEFLEQITAIAERTHFTAQVRVSDEAAAQRLVNDPSAANIQAMITEGLIAPFDGGGGINEDNVSFWLPSFKSGWRLSAIENKPAFEDSTDLTGTAHREWDPNASNLDIIFNDPPRGPARLLFLDRWMSRLSYVVFGPLRRIPGLRRRIPPDQPHYLRKVLLDGLAGPRAELAAGSTRTTFSITTPSGIPFFDYLERLPVVGGAFGKFKLFALSAELRFQTKTLEQPLAPAVATGSDLVPRYYDGAFVQKVIYVPGWLDSMIDLSKEKGGFLMAPRGAYSSSKGGYGSLKDFVDTLPSGTTRTRIEQNILPLFDKQSSVYTGFITPQTLDELDQLLNDAAGPDTGFRPVVPDDPVVQQPRFIPVSAHLLAHPTVTPTLQPKKVHVSPHPDRIPTPTQPVVGKVYVAQDGDSLTAIAAANLDTLLTTQQRTLNPVEQTRLALLHLEELNPQVAGDPNLVEPGEHLHVGYDDTGGTALPWQARGTPQQNWKYDIAKPGDTLSSIAEQRRLTLQQLLALNPQFEASENTISVGDDVRVA